MGWEWAGNGLGMVQDWVGWEGNGLGNGPEWSGNCLEVELDWKWAGNGITNRPRNGLGTGWNGLEMG